MTVVFEADRFSERAELRNSLLLLGHSYLSGSLTPQVEADRFAGRALSILIPGMSTDLHNLPELEVLQ